LLLVVMAVVVDMLTYCCRCRISDQIERDGTKDRIVRKRGVWVKFLCAGLWLGSYKRKRATLPAGVHQKRALTGVAQLGTVTCYM
jgi:hypothetical protein